MTNEWSAHLNLLSVHQGSDALTPMETIQIQELPAPGFEWSSSGRRSTSASHQIISYQIPLPYIPRVTTISRERVAPVPTMAIP
jgi:hypothetical protein